MTEVSVCTIARGRDDHLRNMVAGLAQQTEPPSELIIAHMQPDPYEALPATPFPVIQIPVPGDRLPLAQARNAAAEAASGATLVFLDVDCIPLRGLIAGYQDVMRDGVCVMGETRYLPQIDHLDSYEPAQLWPRALLHPARRFSLTLGPGLQRIKESTEFWSLSFALTAQTFADLGGFDEDFVGYGGEDTDFALRLGKAGVELWFQPEARAVHQWHRIQKPPLSQIDDILTNARLFRAKHGRWCMEYWLGQFEDAGFIRWQGGELELLRRPSAHDLEGAVCDGLTAFS